ncbi:MAG TPA: ABC transporter ATP-binding protein [Candidatus Rifleibacterium sp.]|nr:ABC transporter ATP-binding protein [Candidatus Rifleibacterium sp.]HPT44335.1 ABC transporter ATP-binding protein [Candidatus Rifleibacterium sp.]
MTDNQPAIKVDNLVKFFGRKQILKGLGFNVPLNTIAGFLGPNGAGKTTTLRVLLGLIPNAQGQVSLLGHQIPACRTAALEEIGAVVENPAFIESLNAYENLYWFGSLYKPLTRERILEVIEMVGLKDATWQRFGTFSTGMKQRLGVAFGILHRPRLLILDEPTSGMDPAGRVHMREILTRIHQQDSTSIFLSSHLLDEIQRLCNYVVIINDGKTVKEGYVSELLSDHHEKWEIRVSDEDAVKAREVITALPGSPASIAQGPRGLILTMAVGQSAFVNAELVKAGVRVNAIIPLEASLEETFIKLTGNGDSSGGGT